MGQFLLWVKQLICGHHLSFCCGTESHRPRMAFLLLQAHHTDGGELAPGVGQVESDWTPTWHPQYLSSG